MSQKQEELPIVDVVSVFVSPVLVMLMVGSLTFFLIETAYAGNYEGRLLYTFFFFVLGAVLIARISIQHGRNRAAIYGIGLGAACFIAMLAYVEYSSPTMKLIGPIINLLMMGLIWWSAHKLTWDCTHLAEDQKASGRGVLAAAGLDGTPSTTADEENEVFDPDRSTIATKKKKKSGKYNEPTTGLLGWFSRFRKYREFQKKKPHTPGVWVFYFALAALPLFALGQSLIPADDAERRRDTFFQMAVYIGSALGLLMTTTLMGLRRYLQARGATLSPKITSAWLSIGSVLIMVFLAFGALLPRPHSETPIVDLKLGSGGKRSASNNAQVKDSSTGEGKGQTGDSDKDGNKQGKTDGDGKGKNNPSGKQPGGEKNAGGQGKGEKSGGNKSDNKGEKSGSSKSDEGNKSTGQSQSEKSEESERSEKSGSENNEDKLAQELAQKQRQGLIQAGELISKFGKWLVWTAIIILILIGLMYYGLHWLAPFTGWANAFLSWLQALFNKKKKVRTRRADTGEIVEETEKWRPRPFVEFLNPFASGKETENDPRALVLYTFEAFVAWAWEQGIEYSPHETATEFASRVGEEFPDLEEPGLELAQLHMRAMFSNAQLPESVKPRLELFWEGLTTAERIVSV